MSGTLQRKFPVSNFPDTRTCHTLRTFYYRFIRPNNIRNLVTSDILLTKTAHDCIKKCCHTSANRKTFAYYSKTGSYIPPYFIHPRSGKLLNVDGKTRGKHTIRWEGGLDSSQYADVIAGCYEYRSQKRRTRSACLLQKNFAP